MFFLAVFTKHEFEYGELHYVFCNVLDLCDIQSENFRTAESYYMLLNKFTRRKMLGRYSMVLRILDLHNISSRFLYFVFTHYFLTKVHILYFLMVSLMISCNKCNKKLDYQPHM